MKKIVSILTATRAEYGLLKPIMIKLREFDDIDVRIVVTGMHLRPEYGLTYKDIEKDGLTIDKKIDILDDSDTAAAISKAMGKAMINFADYYEELKPDLLIVLGDRYETLAVSCVAMNAKIPIAHLHGGETTEGAIDESVRHAITKMSYLHFTSTEEYRKRVIQLGEAPDRVFNVGAIGVENVKNLTLLSKEELGQILDFELIKPYGIITYHPETLENKDVEVQFMELLNGIDMYPNLDYIFTKANADANGRVINQLIDQYVAKRKNSIAFESLGTIRYLSAMKYCAMIIGNSSSGIIEAPSFGVPTINIGDRQKGRLQGDSVINCNANKDDIIKAIKQALNIEFRETLKNTINPYGDGIATSDNIVKIIHEYLLGGSFNLKKCFYNID